MNELNYSIIKTQRKHLSLIVKWDGSIQVRAPHSASSHCIKNFVDSKRRWVEKKLTEFQSIPKLNIRSLTEGSSLPYLGMEHEIKFTNDSKQVTLSENKLLVPVVESLILKKLLYKWYRAEASTLLIARCKYYSKLLNLYPSEIKLSYARSKWGSCSKKGRIFLSWRLIMTSLEIIDYVIIHELIHLKFFDHSPAFWQAVKDIIPNYEEAKHWLKLNGHNLDF